MQVTLVQFLNGQLTFIPGLAGASVGRRALAELALV
jgi:hypothetical protein